MKKKIFAILLTAALVAVQPFGVLAAGSADTDSSQVTSSQSSSGTATTSADGKSLATNGSGSKSEGISAAFAVGVAETAGLPEQTVASINSINSGVSLAVAVGNAELEGYSALTQTSAIVLNEQNTNVVANQEASVSLYIPNLIDNLQNVKILIYENATGLWKVVEPSAIDFANKTVTFNMFGSGTVTVIHK